MTSFLQRLDRPPHGKRPPLRSTKEFAQDLGVSVFAIGQALSTDRKAGKPVPKPVAKSKNSNQTANYYVKSEFLAWWQSRKP